MPHKPSFNNWMLHLHCNLNFFGEKCLSKSFSSANQSFVCGPICGTLFWPPSLVYISLCNVNSYTPFRENHSFLVGINYSPSKRFELGSLDPLANVLPYEPSLLVLTISEHLPSPLLEHIQVSPWLKVYNKKRKIRSITCTKNVQHL